MVTPPGVEPRVGWTPPRVQTVVDNLLKQMANDQAKREWRVKGSVGQQQERQAGQREHQRQAE